MTATFGSLFAGIGGIDLGLERAGWSCSWQVEIDDYCRKVLTKHWPEVPKYGDIHGIDWRGIHAVDLVAGGFPCQPVSLAGRRAGQDDERWLWPEFARCVAAVRPPWVLIENVPGLLSGGTLDDESGEPLLEAGLGEVLGGLADLGYDAEWHRIPAAAVGAPHLRNRIFIVAHARGERRQQVTGSSPAHEGTDAGWAAQQDHLIAGNGQGSTAGHVADTGVAYADLGGDRAQVLSGQAHGADTEGPSGRLGRSGHGGGEEDVADSDRAGLEERCWLFPDGASQSVSQRSGQVLPDTDPIGWHGGAGMLGEGRRRQLEDGGGGPAESGLRGVDDGLSSGLEQVGLNVWSEGEWPGVPRVSTGVKNRVNRLKGLGNAVVPQVVQFVGTCILALHEATRD